VSADSPLSWLHEQKYIILVIVGCQAKDSDDFNNKATIMDAMKVFLGCGLTKVTTYAIDCQISSSAERKIWTVLCLDV
jgi:hypothetical protein